MLCCSFLFRITELNQNSSKSIHSDDFFTGQTRMLFSVVTIFLYHCIAMLQYNWDSFLSRLSTTLKFRFGYHAVPSMRYDDSTHSEDIEFDSVDPFQIGSNFSWSVSSWLYLLAYMLDYIVGLKFYLNNWSSLVGAIHLLRYEFIFKCRHPIF